MSEWRSFISILKGSVFDIIVLLTTFILTVLVDLTVAIEVGVVLSAILFMKRMSDISEKRIATNVVDTDVIEDYSQLPKGVGVYEISGPLFFASARRFSEVIQETGQGCNTLILRMRHVSFIDETGMQNLQSSLKILNHSGVKVILSGVSTELKTDLKKRLSSKILASIDMEDSFEKALEHAKLTITY